MKPKYSLVLGILVALLGREATSPPPVLAGPITINVTKTADYTARRDTCISFKGKTEYEDCVNNANLSTTALGEDDALFLDGFTEWNATNAAGSSWVLAYGGELPGGAFNVSTFDTFALVDRGGVEIQIDWTYAGEDRQDFRWSQAIEVNNLLDGTFVDPYFKMDVIRGPCNNSNFRTQCPPLYPPQYSEGFFYDKPTASWPNGFFSAAAFLTKADFTTRTLTYYEGVHYSFRLNANEREDEDDGGDKEAPEPAILALALIGAAGMRLRKRLDGNGSAPLMPSR